MKIKNIKYVALAAVFGMGATSCDDFLDRPTEDNYNQSNFYQNDTQCVQGVNFLYNSPWYDFQRGFFKVGEVMSGNYYWGKSPYLDFTVNGTDQDLVNMSYSLWSVIAYCNTVYKTLQTANCSENVRRQCMAECLSWKAMAYFYLARTFGAVPIVHDNSQELAEDVIDNSGRKLMANYADIFRLQNNNCEESLIGWRWDAASGQYTAQNTLQSDLAMVGFDEFGDNWGGYNGPSIDLQLAFGVTPDQNPKDRDKSVIDTRRKATMMMAGDKYEYFWQDKGGFDYINFIYDKDGYGKGGPGELQSPTGANEVKHLYGNANDHMKGLGVSAASMSSSLSTHLLRLADVYLIYVEAVIGNQGSTTDEKARDVFWQVRHRAVSEYKLPASVSWEDVWKERRLELACEGDRWYDFVRLSYYDSSRAINELVNQKRDVYDNLNTLYKSYYESGQTTWNATSDQHYTNNPKVPNVTKESFTLPFPSEDVVFNPNLMEDPVHVDVRTEYSY